MKKVTCIISSFLAVGLLATSACMAVSSNLFDVAMHCDQVSRQLEQLANNNRNVPCVENVALSATYLDAATKNLWHAKTPQALMHLNFASKELNVMSGMPQCAYFIPKIKPFLVTLVQLKVEIEMLDPNQISKAHQ